MATIILYTEIIKATIIIGFKIVGKTLGIYLVNFGGFYRFLSFKIKFYRVSALGKSYFLNKEVLDIGCNDGSLDL